MFSFLTKLIPQYVAILRDYDPVGILDYAFVKRVGRHGSFLVDLLWWGAGRLVYY